MTAVNPLWWRWKAPANHSGREDEDEWDVSTDRAITVRKYMSEEGVKPDQFHKVTGYGNRRPLQDKLGELDHPITTA